MAQLLAKKCNSNPDAFTNTLFIRDHKEADILVVAIGRGHL